MKTINSLNIQNPIKVTIKNYRLVIILIALFGLFNIYSSNGQTISKPAVTVSTFCPGGKITVAYTKSGFASGVTFTAQLSSAAGTFTTPLASSPAATTSPLTITIPANPAAGSLYRIRVKSSTSILGPDTGAFNILTVAQCGSSWATSGNGGISPSSFIGTADNASLRIKTNGIQRAVFDSVGGISLGINASATGLHAIAIGAGTKATNSYGVAIGAATTASGSDATAMGYLTVASGALSTAMGYGSVASSTASTAMGEGSEASGDRSTAMGEGTIASGERSTAMGKSTVAPAFGETSIGIYNLLYTPASTSAWNATDRLFSIGNGSSLSARSNAMTVLKNGNVGIGTATPAAKLDVNGQIKISGGSPVAGSVLTAIDNTGLASWQTIAPGSGGGWGLSGNAISAGNFIGTTNGQPLIFKVNGIQAGKIDSSSTGGSMLLGYQAGGGTSQMGVKNTAIGFQALNASTRGSANTALGYHALYLNDASGSNNTAIGSAALATNTGGSGNTAIGYNADVTSAGLTNATAIGANAKVNSSNSLVLGNNANVGIGTSSPAYKLDVAGNGRFTSGLTGNASTPYQAAVYGNSAAPDHDYGVYGASNTSTGIAVYGYAMGGSRAGYFAGGDVDVDGGNVRVNNGDLNVTDGNLQINYGNLNVYGSGYFDGPVFANSDEPYRAAVNGIGHASDNDQGVYGECNSSTGIGMYGKANGGGHAGFFEGKVDIWDGNLNVNNGRICIGTSSPAGDNLLTVQGNIICEQLKVKLHGNWPDYVFEKSHNLMSIEELESNIAKNKHLPGIPPASEVESGGVNVGEMQTKMMEKTEENTLYIIQLNNKIKELENMLEALTRNSK